MDLIVQNKVCYASMMDLVLGIKKIVSGEFIVMPSWWSWEALSAIATFIAVVLALFQERVRNWWNKPNPTIAVCYRRDIISAEGEAIPRESVVTLSVRNDKSAIENAKVFWVASEYKTRQSKILKREKVFPEVLFPWTAKAENSLDSKSILLYGEETFDFFRSREILSGFWRPSLIFENSVDKNPFKEFLNNPPNSDIDPNFEFIIYLQIRGSNYAGDYWPIWIKCYSGVVGGWLMTAKAPISTRKFFKMFPRDTEDFFRKTSEKIIAGKEL